MTVDRTATGSRSSKPLSIGIVGGSIAGCLTAIELRGCGHQVTVFEHSRAELKGLLGAVLGTPTPMFKTMLERGHIGHDLPHLNLQHMEFVGRAAGSHRGHVALRLPLVFVAFHWGDFYRRLRSQVPDDVYLAGLVVASVDSHDGGATIQLEDGTEHEFDLVVAADGLPLADPPLDLPGQRARLLRLRVLAGNDGRARDGFVRAAGPDVRALRV